MKEALGSQSLGVWNYTRALSQGKLGALGSLILFVSFVPLDRCTWFKVRAFFPICTNMPVFLSVSGVGLLSMSH